MGHFAGVEGVLALLPSCKSSRGPGGIVLPDSMHTRIHSCWTSTVLFPGKDKCISSQDAVCVDKKVFNLSCSSVVHGRNSPERLAARACLTRCSCFNCRELGRGMAEVSRIFRQDSFCTNRKSTIVFISCGDNVSGRLLEDDFEESGDWYVTIPS